MVEVQQIRDCCICGDRFTGMGCNPEPFGQGDERCCQDCDDRFVIPVRTIIGRAVHIQLLEFLVRIAKTGRLLIQSKAMISAVKRKSA